MLDAIRKRFPPPIVFHIDCNGGYDLKEDFDFLSSLDQYELAMIEQPLNPTTGGNAGDLLDHAELASIIKTPICLDESINSLRSAERAIEFLGVPLPRLKRPLGPSLEPIVLLDPAQPVPVVLEAP